MNDLSKLIEKLRCIEALHSGSATPGEQKAAYNARDKISVLADDRERDSGVIENLLAREEVDLDIKRLGVGDYLVDNRLLFERKTLPDLGISIVQKRFFKQARALSDSSYRGIIILEGSGKDLREISVTRKAVHGALISAGVVMGLAILRSLNPWETADLLVYAGRQVNSFITDCAYPIGRRPKGKRKKQLQVLQSLPNIGPQRARLLLEQFGNVRSVFEASEKDLEEVEKIGPKTAEDIQFVLREEEANYLTCVE